MAKHARGKQEPERVTFVMQHVAGHNTVVWHSLPWWRLQRTLLAASRAGELRSVVASGQLPLPLFLQELVDEDDAERRSAPARSSEAEIDVGAE